MNLKLFFITSYIHYHNKAYDFYTVFNNKPFFVCNRSFILLFNNVAHIFFSALSFKFDLSYICTLRMYKTTVTASVRRQKKTSLTSRPNDKMNSVKVILHSIHTHSIKIRKCAVRGRCVSCINLLRLIFGHIRRESGRILYTHKKTA